MSTPRISLCMIVRDEQPRLARALESVRGVVDELCLVDTGSRDGTPELARSLGARVESQPWSDDFSAARNRSLRLARGEWALVLDADEQLVSTAARERLHEFAARRPAHAGQLAIVNAQAGEESRFLAPRFLPLLAGLSYRGRIHEQPELDGRSLPRADTGVVLQHDGYAPERLERAGKLERNRRLLERELEDHPGDGYLWFQLARTRHVAGEPEPALAACEHALERTPVTASWHAPLVETAAYALRELGRSEEARVRLGAELARHARRADACFVAALLALDVGDFVRAEQGFQRALELGPDALSGESSRAASGWGAHFNLGVLREGLGRAPEARACYERALALRPGHAPILAALQRVASAG